MEGCKRPGGFRRFRDLSWKSKGSSQKVRSIKPFLGNLTNIQRQGGEPAVLLPMKSTSTRRHVAFSSKIFHSSLSKTVQKFAWTDSCFDTLLGFAKFRCGQRWREPNDVGIGKFLLPRRLVLCYRCQHRNLAHSDMAFFTVQRCLKASFVKRIRWNLFFTHI